MKKEDLKEHYKENKTEIENRLKEFEELKEASEKRLFQELVFVILTSQTDAEKAWDAAKELEEKNLLLEGNKNQVAEVLRQNKVQYEENKASYIVENRKNLSQPTLEDPSSELKLKNKIDPDNLDQTREWLAENIQGISWKGASHFLRNIGYGNNFAIISSHILKSMSELGLIKAPETPSNKEEYLEYEKKLQRLSEDLEINIKALDLVTWSKKTGEVFK